VVIVHTDITRATPNERILPVLLAELEQAGARREDITLLNGLGTHRKQTEAELRAMLGDAVVDGYRCLQHDCFDDAGLVSLGVTGRGHPVRINRAYMQAGVKILTGFIEPHFFAGFSGGPKAILPSLAGAESVFTNHGLAMIGHPQATWGVTEGNPIWEEMREVALRTEPTFLLNVALNTRRAITRVFAGDMLQSHAAGCEFVRTSAMAEVDALYDIVVTTNSGYPLDQNLYQTVKGMSAAAQIVRPGGAIVMAAACADGLPNHGQYAALLARAGSPQSVLDLISQPGFSSHDQWQVQIQAQIQLKAEVHVHSGGLSDEQIQRALFLPCRSIEDTVARLLARYGPAARLCVMPDGPLTIPYVRQTAGNLT
jgi:nickel-dependent lactate racemase